MVYAFIRRAGAAFALTLCAAAVQAQSAWPAKPVKIVVPFGAGGVTDLFARQLAERVAPALGQPVLVENRTGQGGAIGAGSVAKAEPDGYTVLLAGSANSIGETLYPNLPFSMLKDFTPVTRVVSIVNVFTVPGNSRFKSVGDVLAAARSQPGKLTYSSSGNGGHYHLAMEMFKMGTGAEILHVPYKTEPAGRTDLIAGRTDMMITAFGSAQGNLQQGQLRPLAVTSSRRFAGLPDTPTLAEAGVPGYEGDAWIGLMMPAGTPREAVERLHQEVQKALQQPEFRERLAQQGMTPIEDTPQRFGEFLKTDVDKWKGIIQKSGAKVD